jgi:hypothetical protein
MVPFKISTLAVVVFSAGGLAVILMTRAEVAALWLAYLALLLAVFLSRSAIDSLAWVQKIEGHRAARRTARKKGADEDRLREERWRRIPVFRRWDTFLFAVSAAVAPFCEGRHIPSDKDREAVQLASTLADGLEQRTKEVALRLLKPFIEDMTIATSELFPDRLYMAAHSLSKWVTIQDGREYLSERRRLGIPDRLIQPPPVDPPSSMASG